MKKLMLVTVVLLISSDCLVHAEEASINAESAEERDAR